MDALAMRSASARLPGAGPGPPGPAIIVGAYHLRRHLRLTRERFGDSHDELPYVIRRAASPAPSGRAATHTGRRQT